ncbi:F-box/FBD/LRR-repeat protein, partial [Trifolium medium]|nr:F-box/FBD/LRR-repeat protein [Trifolium medium]
MLSSPAAQDQQPLKRFYLTCGEAKQWNRSLTNCFFKLDEWIEAALGRGVEVLDLRLYGLPVPCSIFSCKTLVVLKLWKILVRMNGCSVDLPLLKKLDLNDILFHDMEDIMELLSGCPKLEDLSTRFLFQDRYYPPLFSFQPNGVIGTQGVTPREYFRALTKLIKANFNLFEVPFRAVYNVRFLSVSEMGCSLPNEEINSYYQALPLFQNVIELRLSWCSTVLHYWIDVVKMLESCPKLQALYIDKWIVSPTTEDLPIHVPECVSSHLTTCTITNYEAAEADFRFAAYLLKNARHLQNMKIQLLGTLNMMQRAQCFEDLSSCPRISP